MMAQTINSMRDEFETAWSQTLVNVMRPLNSLAHKGTADIDEDY